MRYLGLDFETYGGVSLPDHGLDRYVRDRTFVPLCAAVHDGSNSEVFDFVKGDRRKLYAMLEQDLQGAKIVAHNAGFERAVLRNMGIDLPAYRFIDSAVVARAAGGGGSLEAAAPQLLGTNKLDMGKNLIKLFSIPGKYQEENGNLFFDDRVVFDHPKEWEDFMYYCTVDAKLSWMLEDNHRWLRNTNEYEYAAITLEMNDTGWPVDVELVKEMNYRYLTNQQQALEDFRDTNSAPDLNLNSLPQLKKWCADRGIRARSFDEKNVERLRKRIEEKLQSGSLSDDKYVAYSEVHHLLVTKQILGGSSLKKLKVILDTQRDGRLKDQYIHVGAGQTWRTTGRSAQMQNLKRLGEHVDDVQELFDEAVHWDNDTMARNLRQVFTASHAQGRLIVGDFSSVESRGLAWLSGEDYKLRAYAAGQDIYKVLAMKIYPGLAYDAVTKPQRQTGKVGELSCGYGAGGGAVQSFAAGMGVEMTEMEAASLVYDWRDANPATVAFWEWLNEALHAAVDQSTTTRWALPDGFVLEVSPVLAPKSLVNQARSLKMTSVVLNIHSTNGNYVLWRVFHGCHRVGRDIRYFKPSERKTGDLWSDTYTNPKTKQLEHHKLYGGKMAGILTQSLCREIFMERLAKVAEWLAVTPGIDLIGQFHDEIVLDWQPTAALSYSEAERELEIIMSAPGRFPSFPMAAEVKSAYRYIK